MSSSLVKFVKGVVGVVVLIAIAVVLRSWVTDYKSAAARDEKKVASLEESSTSVTTSTPSSLATGKGSGRVYTPATITSGTKFVVVLIDGLNLRERPEADAKSVTALKKGESLTLLSTKRDGWYEVKSSDHGKGWVSSNPSYTQIKER